MAVKGDPEIDAAKTAILERLHSTPDQVYYATQLAVLFEPESGAKTVDCESVVTWGRTGWGFSPFGIITL